MEKEISQAVVSRLPRYFRYLGDLKEQGIERISSQELSRLMKVTASPSLGFSTIFFESFI